MKVTQEQIEDMLYDPVALCYAVTGLELDDHQAVRFKYFWFGKLAVEDSSGISTGKTVLGFAALLTSAFVFPNIVCSAYFPVWQTGKDEMWAKWDTVFEKRPWLYDQLVFNRNGEWCEKNQGNWKATFKNGSRFEMPAPGFLTQAKSSASKRINRLWVDDWIQANEMGKKSGIDTQLMDRVTRECFNQWHPVWCNKVLLTGHAQGPHVRAYKRHSGYRRAIQEGRCNAVQVSFCVMDWADKFKSRFQAQAMLEGERAGSTRTDLLNRHGGLWLMGGATAYPGDITEPCLDGTMKPILRRERDDEYFVCGFDTSSGLGENSDFSAFHVDRLRPCEPDAPGAWLAGDAGFFQIEPAGLWVYRRKPYKFLSGLYYLLDERYGGFAATVYDPLGGGTQLTEWLAEEKQIVGGVKKTVVPVVDERASHGMLVGRSILHPFARRDPVNSLFLPHFMTRPEGLVDAMHKEYQKMWQNGVRRWPRPLDQREPGELAILNEREKEMMAALDREFLELSRVSILTEPDGKTFKTSGAGFRLYRAGEGKKDAAYSGAYSSVAAMLVLRKLAGEAQTRGPALGG